MSMNELDSIRRNADVLWQEVNKKLQSGVGVPAIELNRVHWIAALQELEILRDASVHARRLQNMLKIKDGRIAGLMHDLYGDGTAHEPLPAQLLDVQAICDERDRLRADFFNLAHEFMNDGRLKEAEAINKALGGAGLPPGVSDADIAFLTTICDLHLADGAPATYTMERLHKIGQRLALNEEK